ncbi:DUF917 family protein [Paeniglutamicibacter sp. NPDC012692]|uniref:S-methyl thiohydantoin desulfurase domain-containing protein n=1 Tax=Paeniglutamicibacter sp. NPDC012692 TaxID=3364388 RepID=UPI0036BEEDD4
MTSILGQDRLPALARGFSLLGSGGGGKTTLQELILGASNAWPLNVHQVRDVDPALSCVAIAYVGSTHFMHERLPVEDPFSPLLAAAARWSGTRPEAVCALEGGGVNGLTALGLAHEMVFVDADFTGRAYPRLDQMSLYVDKVPGLFAVCDTGAGGVAIVNTDRAEDMEKVIRAAVIQAGGVAPVLLGGFHVGDLREHAITGIYLRALELGDAFMAAEQEPVPVLAERLGARFLGQGRITAIEISARTMHNSTIEVTCNDGGISRVIARSEFLAYMSEGKVLAATPEIIVVLDSLSRAILQVDEVTQGRHVDVLSLPAPSWWLERSERLAHVLPAFFGLNLLERGT